MRARALAVGLVLVAAAILFALQHSTWLLHFFAQQHSVVPQQARLAAAAPVRQIAAPAPPAPSIAAPPLRAGDGRGARTVVRCGWGSGPDELGRRRDRESVAEGPMSLTVDGRGNLLILDQINRRVQRFAPDGRRLGALPIASDTVQDLALGKRGTLALLDRLTEGKVRLYADDGRLLGEAPLRGPGLSEGGAATGLFTDRDGNLYVEREHRALVRIADSDGNADPARPTLPGRPSRDGRLYLNAAIVDRAAGTAEVRALDAQGALLWQTPVSLGAPILYLSLLDSDATGEVYLGGHAGHEAATAPFRVYDEQLVVVGLSPDGSLHGVLRLPDVPAAEESFRDLAVGDDGTIYRMSKTERGVTVEAYRL
jgi:hypothetical protein